MFPKIRDIQDILPHIKDKKEFIVANKDGYTVIDYVFTKNDTFENSIHSECRGIKFTTSGSLLSRPFHKFHNYGENEKYTNVSFRDSHYILDKLDGSMIHSAYLEGELVFMTRMGITDHALRAFNLFGRQENYRSLCDVIESYKSTPMFEFTAPDNRIVIGYDKPELTLLDIRHKETGKYWDREGIIKIAQDYQISSVPGYKGSELGEPKKLIEETRKILGKEGIVISFSSGFKVKIKADDYVLKHRTLAFFNSQDKILDLIFEGKVDDVLPLLEEGDISRLLAFEIRVRDCIQEQTTYALEVLNLIKSENLTRKEAAIKVMKECKDISPVIFKCLDGQDCYSIMEAHLNKNRHLLNVIW